MEQQIDHVGLRVSSLDRARELLVDRLRFNVHMEDVRPDLGLRVAFIGAEHGPLMEVVEYDDGSPRVGQGVFDHVAFRVRDLEASVLQWQSHGVEFEQSTPRSVVRPDGRFRTMMTSPGSTYGMKLQLIGI